MRSLNLLVASRAINEIENYSRSIPASFDPVYNAIQMENVPAVKLNARPLPKSFRIAYCTV